MMESSEKETRAIFLNFKEVRCLEKNMQALDLEKSYNISLINLDQKVVKVRFKRLKEKVSRIKSHLKPDELGELQKLEEEGKLQVKTPVSDLNVKILAAEKRLKLMPRAKSAVPRLQSEKDTDKITDLLKSPRSARRVRTPAATPHKELTPRKDLTSRKEKSVATHSPQESAHSRPVSATFRNEGNESDYLVPKSVREERKKSIDILCLNDDIKSLKIPGVKVIAEEDDSNSLHGSYSSQNELDTLSTDLSNKVQSTNLGIPVANAEINKHKTSLYKSDIKTLNGSNPNGNIKINCTKNSRSGQTSDAQMQKRNKNDSLITICAPNSPKSKSCSQSLNTGSSSGTKSINNKEKSSSKFISDDLMKPGSPIIKITDVDKDENAADKQFPLEPDLTTAEKEACQTQYLNTKIRPMSVPATQITNFEGTSKMNRPKTAMELAVETRKKSVIDIRRASAMLKEGKTRSPFSCHEQNIDEVKDKPFRYIREGINTVSTDSEVLDNTLGDDLHRDLKKGMILGEVATSLYLEEKIDHFLEKVDGYVKENPNYVFDPNAPRTKKVSRVKEKKKPKRNRLRRRQLERQLQEGNIEEMKKSRWLRLEDDKLDISGMNTLVVDQMRMMNKLRHPYDEED